MRWPEIFAIPPFAKIEGQKLSMSETDPKINRGFGFGKFRENFGYLAELSKLLTERIALVFTLKTGMIRDYLLIVRVFNITLPHTLSSFCTFTFVSYQINIF